MQTLTPFVVRHIHSKNAFPPHVAIDRLRFTPREAFEKEFPGPEEFKLFHLAIVRRLDVQIHIMGIPDAEFQDIVLAAEPHAALVLLQKNRGRISNYSVATLFRCFNHSNFGYVDVFGTKSYDETIDEVTFHPTFATHMRLVFGDIALKEQCLTALESAGSAALALLMLFDPVLVASIEFSPPDIIRVLRSMQKPQQLAFWISMAYDEHPYGSQMKGRLLAYLSEEISPSECLSILTCIQGQFLYDTLMQRTDFGAWLNE